MASLSKCLAFNYKYQPEMHRLYIHGDEGSELDAETRAMIQEVGQQCDTDASKFLESCGKVIEQKFDAIANCLPGKRARKKWSLEYGVWPTGNYKPKNQIWKMRVGVELRQDATEALAWVWGDGKLDVEDKMCSEFGSTVKRSADFGLDGGTVVVARVPLAPSDDNGFDVDYDQIVASIKTGFACIDKSNFENVYNYIRSI